MHGVWLLHLHPPGAGSGFHAAIIVSILSAGHVFTLDYNISSFGLARSTRPFPWPQQKRTRNHLSFELWRWPQLATPKSLGKHQWFPPPLSSFLAHEVKTTCLCTPFSLRRHSLKPAVILLTYATTNFAFCVWIWFSPGFGQFGLFLMHLGPNYRNDTYLPNS